MSAPVDCDPLVALVPVHEPPALQAVALVDDQVSVELAPEAIEPGLALTLTVGAGLELVPVTVTVADWVAEPPGPVHVNSNTVVLVRGPVERRPPVDIVPCQPPEAVQAVVPVVLQ